MMRIVEDDLSDPRVLDLLRTHFERARAESPPGSFHALDLAAMRSPDIVFWTIWDKDAPVGMGALKRLSAEHGEIKSMHVAEAMRRQGAASAMLGHVVAAARSRGISRLSLETGAQPYFAPARALYRRHGFVECEPFADYKPDPNSVFMTLEFTLETQRG
jgi:putative acetyltransferase